MGAEEVKHEGGDFDCGARKRLRSGDERSLSSQVTRRDQTIICRNDANGPFVRRVKLCSCSSYAVDDGLAKCAGGAPMSVREWAQVTTVWNRVRIRPGGVAYRWPCASRWRARAVAQAAEDAACAGQSADFYELYLWVFVQLLECLTRADWYRALCVEQA